MAAIYEKPVRLLLKYMVHEIGINQGDVITRDQVIAWFHENYPKIKNATISAHFLKMSTNAPSRVHYNVNLDGEDDLFFQIDSRRFRLYNPMSDPEPIYKQPSTEVNNGEEESIEPATEVREFAYEKDLQNFLSKNLTLIESGLHLYEEEGITGIEFPAGNRFVDILALDKKKNYVVIELKVSRGYDRAVGQLLRYVGWISKNLADDNQSVRGILVAREISDDILLACSTVDNVDLYEYQLSVSLQKINAD